MTQMIFDDAMTGRAMRRTGTGVSAVVALLLALDAAGKLFAPEMMIANSPPLGLPDDPAFHRVLGLILAVCVVLYAVPRTALLGAILLTGFLGGAVATHARINSPLFSHTLFGVYLGIALWLGLYLRDARLRALLAGFNQVEPQGEST